MAPQRLNRPRALSPVRGSEVPVLVSVLLLLISASIYFLYLKREVYSSESASVYVHQRTWNFLTLTGTAHLLWCYPITSLTSSSDLCFALCIHGTHVLPLSLLIYHQVVASWHTNPASFLSLLCWFLIHVGRWLLPMETQLTKLCSLLLILLKTTHPLSSEINVHVLSVYAKLPCLSNISSR